MSIIESSNAGNVSISDDVIMAILSQAISECYGLVAMAPKDLLEGLNLKMSEKGRKKGIAIYGHDDYSVTVELHVIMAYGVRIPEVARTVMERAKLALETQLGVTVREVNVHVHGIKVPKG
ncbi:Asp23/Gls24 family envelope stress response protein [Heliorestis convoluta]|uniref:Putative asp23 family protein n=1 Tax=Heliorestis convoluta TaxID=356322 RepID=A0A5Q2N2K2_9FIRM|nr:Asp23/Gls24 family envelope stress response protein [Heliorestis convoluta]QGG48099.1 putative asp23 family protein [Heliorestis convoluta]